MGVHIPDGFTDAPVSVAAGAVAIGAVALSLRGARRELTETSAPMAGLTAVFIFAAQMVNFPVASAVSGHLLGATFLAILFGPWMTLLIISAVLILQAFLFQDGGLIALGANIFNLAIVANFSDKRITNRSLNLLGQQPEALGISMKSWSRLLSRR